MYAQLAWRNIWRNTRRTAVILTAVFVGVASMIILAALMRGMADSTVANSIDNLVGHIKAQHPGYRSDPDISHRISDPDALVKALSPELPKGAAVIKRIRVDGTAGNARETVGIQIVGITPADEKGASFIGKAPIEGDMIKDSEKTGIMIGAALADKLQTEIGKKIVLTTQKTDGETGSRAFRIRGVFHAELESMEKAFVFISYKGAERLIGEKNCATEISVVLPQKAASTQLEQYTSKCKSALSGFNVSVYNWKEMIPAISAYLAMFDAFLAIWFVVVFIAMGFGIVNTMLMAVYERMREFGLLKALGMKPSWIVRMVLGESLFLLAAGCAAGTICGVGLTYYFAVTGIDLGAFSQGTDMWAMSRVILPSLDSGDVIKANAIVGVLGLAVSLYPALKAAGFTPVETMRQN